MSSVHERSAVQYSRPVGRVRNNKGREEHKIGVCVCVWRGENTHTHTHTNIQTYSRSHKRARANKKKGRNSTERD